MKHFVHQYPYSEQYQVCTHFFLKYVQIIKKNTISNVVSIQIPIGEHSRFLRNFSPAAFPHILIDVS